MATTESLARGANHVLTRDDLREFHHRFEDRPFTSSAKHRHGPAWKDTSAFTHCICFGASTNAVAPLLDLLAELLNHEEQRYGRWTSGMKARVVAALEGPRP